jgi:parallel beta-helix repeat protein
MKNNIFLFLLSIMLIISLITIVPVDTLRINRNILYVGGGGSGNYSTIQSAIIDANPGDTIFVYIGTYIENVIINKNNLNLIGEDTNSTIIDGDGNGDVVYISGGQVTFTGFTIQNSGSICYNGGIHINSDYNNVSGNRIYNNAEIGVWLDSSDDNIVNNNIIENNGLDGLWIDSSKYNTVSNNFINSNNDDGIVVKDSTQNTITENNIGFNDDNGTSIFSPSIDNNFVKNVIRSNNENGIYINASNNNIYHNSFIHNMLNANDEGENNWDDGYPSGGNFWSDYFGDDDFHGVNQNLPGHDRMGDIPYEILGGNSIDEYPLINQDSWFNDVPYNLTLDGQTYGDAGKEYYYTARAFDPESDPIYYKFDWGDDSFTDWFGPYISGTDASESHTWSTGVYDIRVKAKDTRGLETNWSDPFRITIPRNKDTHQFFLQIFERYLDRFPLIKYFFNILK